jgi:hypothetical protein
MRIHRAVFAAAAAASLIVLYACGGSSSDSGIGGATDAGASDATLGADGTTSATDSGGTPVDSGSANDAGAGVDASVDSGACNDLDLSAAPYVLWNGRGNVPPPVPMGGTIAPGTYTLMAINVYGPSASDAGTSDSKFASKAIIDFQATTFEAAGHTETDSGATIKGNTPGMGTWVSDGGTFALTPTCGGGKGLVADYTAGATTLKIYSALGTGTFEEVYLQ